MWRCEFETRTRKSLQPRCIFLIPILVVVGVNLCAITSYLNSSFCADQTLFQFSEHLAVSVESAQRSNKLHTVFIPSPPPSSIPTMGQATVFYVWCGARRRPFEFRNYLSVRSSLRALQPDTVWFYYESEPIIDDKLYNTWWHELIVEFPFFHRRRLRDVGGRLPRTACDGPGRPAIDYVHALVTSRGGTFVDEATIVVARPPDDGATVAVDFDDQADIRLRLLKAYRGMLCPNGSRNDNATSDMRVLMCPSDSELVDPNSTLCVHINRPMYPKDIWTSDGSVDRLLRREFYGHPEPMRLLPSYDRLAPNIGHVIWVGGGNIDFMFFLSVLSLLHVARVDVVYVHGDRPPTGFYWNLLIDTDQSVKFLLRENARQVFRNMRSKLMLKITVRKLKRPHDVPEVTHLK